MPGPKLKRGGVEQSKFEQGYYEPRTRGQIARGEKGTFHEGYGMGSFTAALPQLTKGVADLLSGTLSNPDAYLRGIMGTQTASAQASIDKLLSGQVGSDIVPAIQKVAGINLNRGSQAIQQQGARFTGAAGQQIADLTQRVTADTNLAVQQALEAQANRQVNALLGAGQLSNQMAGIRVGAIQPLQLAAVQAGTGAPLIQQTRGFWGTMGDLAALGIDVASLFVGGKPSGGGDSYARPGTVIKGSDYTGELV